MPTPSQLLVPNDYRGLASLLIDRAGTVHTPDTARQLAALRLLRQTNPIVRRTLTCFERELGGESFPAGGGGASALPSMTQEGAGFQERRDEAVNGMPAPVQATHVAGLSGVAGVALAPPRYVGAAVSVLELDVAATEERNALRHQMLGDRIERSSGTIIAQAVTGDSSNTSPANATHTTLYSHGQGGFVDKTDDSNCTRQHHRKKTLLSVADPLRTAQEVTSACMCMCMDMHKPLTLTLTQ
jgi:hypothetical protein